MGRFSVIIPYYNARSTLCKALDSVVIQGSLVKEIIIVDDCSSDNCGDLILTYESLNVDIKVKRLENNMGPGCARNYGIGLATGEFIAFLDADDYWLAGKLEAQAEVFDQRKDIEVLGTLTGSPRTANPKVNQLDVVAFGLVDFLISNRVPTRSVAFRSGSDIVFGPSRNAEDYYAWLQYLVSKHRKIYRLERILCVAGRPEYSRGGVSGDLYKHELCEIGVLWDTLRISKATSILIPFAISFSVMKFVRRVIFRTLAL